MTMQHSPLAEFPTLDRATFARGFKLGHAVALGLAGRAGLHVMATGIAKACASDEVIYTRYMLAEDRIAIVAQHGASATTDLPSCKAVAPLKTGHVQNFGPRAHRRCMVVLGRTERHVDVLILSAFTSELLVAAAQTLHEAWTHRSHGMIASLVEGEEEDGSTAPILSSENPFGLTRKEQQVCRFLFDGLKPKDLMVRMSCSMPTVRTHLRNIYAKTGLDGMVAVVHRLHTEAQA